MIETEDMTKIVMTKDDLQFCDSKSNMKFIFFSTAQNILVLEMNFSLK